MDVESGVALLRLRAPRDLIGFGAHGKRPPDGWGKSAFWDRALAG